jgi:hypothetical protein
MSEILKASILKPNLGRRESDGHGLLNKQIENGQSTDTDDYRDHTGCQEGTHKPSIAVVIQVSTDSGANDASMIG